jgi:hypothetical protein
VKIKEVLENGLNNLKRNRKNMKQTAVEWLVEQLKIEEGIDFIPTSLFERAKEMEKAQMEQLKYFEKWKEWKNKPQ